LDAIVNKALAEAEEFCMFGFQGGEPTLAGLDFFKEFIRLEKKYNTRKIKIAHTLQTNGLTLDEEWAAFLKTNNFLTGLSIDASKQLHDSLRPDVAGAGTHIRAMKAAKLLTAHGVQFNILSVVTNRLAAHPDNVYRFYQQNGFRYIQFIPCLDGLDEPRGEFSLSPKKYGEFLCRVFDLWYADFIKSDYYSIRAFDNYINILMGFPPENCAMNGICSVYALIEANGNVYPCDFYALDDYLLGNIAEHSFSDMLRGEKATAFVKSSVNISSACRACEFAFICRGGCRREREPLSEDNSTVNRLCGAYKEFFTHTLPQMRMIAAHLKR
jgi:uncharacterized protein